MKSEFWFKILLSFRRKNTQWGHALCRTFSSLVGIKVTTIYLMDYVLSWNIHNFFNVFYSMISDRHDLCHTKNLYSIMYFLLHFLFMHDTFMFVQLSNNTFLLFIITYFNLVKLCYNIFTCMCVSIFAHTCVSHVHWY